MRKIFTLVLSCIGIFGANAQDVVFTLNDEVLEDNATITIEAEYKEEQGFITASAGTNPTPDTGYFIKNLCTATDTLDISVTSKLNYSTYDDASLTIQPLVAFCTFGTCWSIPSTQTKKIAANGKAKVDCHAEFNDLPCSAVYPGKASLTLTAEAPGQDERTITINFIYGQSGINNVLAGSSISVKNKTLVYDFAKAGNYAVKLYSTTGQLVCNEALEQSGTLSLSELNNGLYIMAIVKDGKTVLSQKCIVK